MYLIDEAVGVVVTNDGKEIITIGFFDQLNKKSGRVLCRVLRRPVGIKGWVSNTGVAMSKISEANLQGMIYYIKQFKSIERTCTHEDVDIAKVRAMYH